MDEYALAAKYIAAAITIGLGTLGPAFAQGQIGSKTCENIGKYPENFNNIRTVMFMAMIFTETLSIFSVLIAMIILMFA
jgi:F-type H+-transporting ATPase subunit c